MNALLVSLVAFVSTVLGGLFAVKFRGKLNYVMGFASGVLLGVVAFDVLPEVFRMTAAGVVGVSVPMAALVIGFLGFHVVEKVILVHGANESGYAEHHHPYVGVMSSVALISHSFMDGMAIGLGFQVSQSVGLVVAFAVVAHDFCDGLNTAAVMIVNKHSVKHSVAMVFADALAPVAGAALTMAVAVPQPVLVAYLGVFAGLLLYIGAADILPEAHSNSTPRASVGITLLTCLGAFLAFLASTLAG